MKSQTHSTVTFVKQCLGENTRALHIAYYLIFAVIVSIFIAAFSPMPDDDFLRHIRFLDYSSLGGYSYMYPSSYFSRFNFDPWYGFDIYAGLISTYVGKQSAPTFFQVAISLLFLSALLVNIRESLDKDTFPLVCILVLLFFTHAFSRLVLIRPAIFVSILFLFGLKGKSIIPGVLGVFLAAVSYWLFFLYSIPLAIAHYLKGRRPFAHGLMAGTVIALAFWTALTHGEYLGTIRHLVSAVFSCRGGIAINENNLPLADMLQPVCFLVIAAALLTLYRRKQMDIYILLILLCLPLSLQVRYFKDIGLPLMFLYAVNQNGEILSTFARRFKGAIDVFALAALLLVIPPLSKYSVYGTHTTVLNGLNLPQGTTVFAQSMGLAFNTIYYNDAPLHIYPSPEPGWNDAETNRMGKKAQQETIDSEMCAYFRAHAIDYVITKGPVNAECLLEERTFLQNDKSTRVGLWQVL